MGRLLTKKATYLMLALILLLTIVACYHTYKPLPEGVSYEGNVHYVKDVSLLYDLTYQSGDEIKSEQQIFRRIFEAIDNAENFIVMDMFLFNGYYDQGETYPPISDTLARKLIEKKKEQPNVDIYFITDEVNTTYGSHESEWLESLKRAGIKVVETDVTKLRDSNPLYSSVWRSFLQWFGQSGEGWLANPFGENAPKITARSYLKLFNVKANHRKVVATDKTAVISSANPHDASGHHSNMAFEVQGDIIGEIVKTEKAVVDFSSDVQIPKLSYEKAPSGDIGVQLLTEGKVYKEILNTLDQVESGDEVWLGMFYLADRKVVEKLVQSSNKGAKVRLVLDPNVNAFGQEKIGLPNRPVAAELLDDSSNKIQVRWYNTDKEQYHPKTLFVRGKDQSTIIGGSANFTKRNLDDLNLETNIKITAGSDEDISEEMNKYFTRLWGNEDATYTLPYEKYENKMTIFQTLLYRIQKMLSFTTY
ncbi:phospholipase D family protein [Priestia flexa]|uniref:phospholipase D family protein n=1 Tax=Priestia flexa TaxID=86664 RepID=UPI00099BE5D1|nr:phospholipase D family protein [Priestia flexa]